jgi:hypothetical protein
MVRTGNQLYLDRSLVLVEAITDETPDKGGNFFCFKVLDGPADKIGREGVAVLRNDDCWSIDCIL